jgi:uncharacterized protein
MRDLGARLREIVRDRGRSGLISPEGQNQTRSPFPPFRLDETRLPVSFEVSDHVRAAGDRHGRRPVGACDLDPTAPIGLFDPRIRRAAGWADRVVFFDIETTGLSGGAGTLAFLVGCGWFEQGAFHVRQFFLRGPGGEPAMLEALAGMLATASLLVTFNGRTFDVPVMETRWAFHRRPCPIDDLPHFDMLPSARRLWGRRPDDEIERRRTGTGPISPDGGCSLSALECSVLGVHRSGDVPGFEIPGRYFHYLRTGDAGVIDGVLEHNRHDLLSLAALTSHALRLARDGPEACREPAEQAALGRLYERAGDLDRAVTAYELAARSGERNVRRHALARLAVLMRREARYDDAAAAWQGVLDGAPAGRRPLTRLERRAVEALAIHHEHRAGDLETAERYAERLAGEASGRQARDAAHRLGRIQRKMAARSGHAGPVHAPPKLPDV